MEHGKLKPLMFAGTGSDVGKSIIVTAICRILKQDGYSPAPFKAQNMSLNSYATPDSLEIGRAQAVQAEAAEIECSTDMNPLLLKPNSDLTSQIVLNGRPVGNSSAKGFFRQEGRDILRKEINSSFDRLSSKYNPIIMEGAGSIAEMNLMDIDLVNMPMARYADANIILVADIDRGGVFASIYGSVMLQKPEDRRRIKGVIINKFRGDISLFNTGKEIIEKTSGIKVLGIIPYLDDIDIDEEDSVSLAKRNKKYTQGKVNIVVVLLPHMSNFTDFARLEHDSRINLYYSYSPEEIAKADITIIPGSKNTISDLNEIRNKGIDTAIIDNAKKGKSVIGICGGYQIMGMEISDPLSIESNNAFVNGLGLLPIRTTITMEKITQQREFSFMEGEQRCKGYEIHMGNSELIDGKDYMKVATFDDGSSDGVMINDRCFGTYLHGILDNKVIVDKLVSQYCTIESSDSMDYDQYKDYQYNRLASHVRENIDMDLFYKILNSDD